jgi:hypothetical protein
MLVTSEIQLEMGGVMEQQEVTTSQLDEQIERLSMLRNRYNGMKTEASVAHQEYKQQEDRVLKLLEIAGKKSYKVDGLCNVSRIEKLSVTTPKTIEDKRAFFSWIREKYGDDGVWSYASINSNTLNSLYNQQVEEAAERGETLDIAGIDLPTTRVSLSLRSINN